ncbi:MAG: hypothetical protein JXA73_26310, partial [Acidobacteria bacterium]|nr:hypothetical protein [Acidobacteriota bacterium]
MQMDRFYLRTKIAGLVKPPMNITRAVLNGRSESCRELDPETHKIVLRRGLRRINEEWPVLIQEHHPGYISFEKYLEN